MVAGSGKQIVAARSSSALEPISPLDLELMAKLLHTFHAGQATAPLPSHHQRSTSEHRVSARRETTDIDSHLCWTIRREYDLGTDVSLTTTNHEREAIAMTG